MWLTPWLWGPPAFMPMMRNEREIERIWTLNWIWHRHRILFFFFFERLTQSMILIKLSINGPQTVLKWGFAQNYVKRGWYCFYSIINSCRPWAFCCGIGTCQTVDESTIFWIKRIWNFYVGSRDVSCHWKPIFEIGCTDVSQPLLRINSCRPCFLAKLGLEREMVRSQT